MITKRFVKSNPVILGCFTVAPDSRKKEPIKFLSNGASKVDIVIDGVVITDNGVTTDFANDDGVLTIHRNDFEIAPGDYEIEIWVIDTEHPAPGQLISEPDGERDSRVILSAK